MGESQYTEETEEKWNKKVKTALENMENKKWETEREKSSRLRTYNKIKKKRKIEKYLESNDVVGRSIMGRLRAGANFLRMDKGREKGEDRDERICRICLKEIEDVEHFILRCDGYTTIRNEYIKKIEKKKKKKKKKKNKEGKENQDKWLKIFLGQHQNEKIIKIAIEYQKRITSERDRFQGKKIFRKMKKRDIYI